VTESKTRRDFLSTAGAGTVGALTASLLSSVPAVAAPSGKGQGAGRRKGKLDFEDPQERFKLTVRMRGSLADEPVHSFVRLHIYGYGHEGNLVPFFSMNNYAVNVWKKLPNGNHAVQVFECGVYTAFDSYDVITEWTNPFTHELRKVHQFRSGPLNVEFGPEGIKAGPETTVKPRPMMTEVIEDSVIATTQSSFKFPSPFQPEEFPKESPGKIFYWDSHATHISQVDALLDPDVASVPSQISMTNLVSWSPWLAMSQRPGRTFGRGIGRKVASAQALPAPVLKSLEQYMPQVLDISKWGPPYDDIADYKEIVKAGRR
jgi:hypothetical protein